MAKMTVTGPASYTGSTMAHAPATLIRDARALLRARRAPAGRYRVAAKGITASVQWEGMRS